MILRTTCFLALVGCASSTATHRRERDTPPDPPTPITLTLGVEGSWIGATPTRGGFCASPITGSITITMPNGTTQSAAIEPADMVDQKCFGCDPVPGVKGSCDNACTTQPRAWIQLIRFSFSAPGDYTIDGDTLAVACGPLQVPKAYVRADAAGRVSVSSEPPTTALVVVAPPAPAPPRPTTDATQLRARFSQQTPALVSHVEALALPTGPHQKKRGISSTKWGDLRTLQTGTTYRVLAGETGPYWIQHRSAPGAALAEVAIDARPHILSIAIEDGTDEARRAGQSGGTIAAAWTQLDGAPPATRGAISLDVSSALDDAAARWAKFLGGQRRPIEEALAAANAATPGQSKGKEKVLIDAEFRPTWVSGSQQLVVLYRERTTRWTQHEVKTTACPRNRPGPCTTKWVSAPRSYHADVAAELIYDKTGSLVAESYYSARPVPGE